jgi:creatinine amidohydrolase/Fe(II)-dependent formamide hydrolase-like protein
VRVADLNTAQIRALDRAKTVVLLPGGMLEEHGPYLPAYTDGILSERLTDELARAAVAGKPGWTALRFPQMPAGSSGSNELGGHFVFSWHRPARVRGNRQDRSGTRWRPRRSSTCLAVA